MSLTLLAVLAGTVVLGGLICGYMTLRYISEQLSASTKNSTSSNLKRNISEDQMLRIQSLLVNHCFQQAVVVSMIIVLVLICVSCGTSLINDKIRKTAFLVECYFFILIVTNSYGWVLVAYSFPGKVNLLSCLEICCLNINFSCHLPLVCQQMKFQEKCLKAFEKWFDRIKI